MHKRTNIIIMSIKKKCLNNNNVMETRFFLFKLKFAFKIIFYNYTQQQQRIYIIILLCSIIGAFLRTLYCVSLLFKFRLNVNDIIIFLIYSKSND